MELITAIKALPKDEQLPAAFDLLRNLIGGEGQDETLWQQRFGLTTSQARVFSTIIAAKGRVVPKETLLTALEECNGSEPDIKIVDMMICHIRKKLRDCGHTNWIITDWGRGYHASEVMLRETHNPTGETVALPSYHRKWTDQDNEDLRLMMARGDDLKVVAEELDRTPRACRDQWRNIQ